MQFSTKDAVPFITDPEDKPAQDAMHNIRALNGYLLGPPGVESLFHHIDKALAISGIRDNNQYLQELQSIAMKLTERINYYENPNNAGIYQKFIWGRPGTSVITKLKEQSEKIITQLTKLQTALSSNNDNYQQADSHKQNRTKRT